MTLPVVASVNTCSRLGRWPVCPATTVSYASRGVSSPYTIVSLALTPSIVAAVDAARGGRRGGRGRHGRGEAGQRDRLGLGHLGGQHLAGLVGDHDEVAAVDPQALVRALVRHVLQALLGGDHGAGGEAVAGGRVQLCRSCGDEGGGAAGREGGGAGGRRGRGCGLRGSGGDCGGHGDRDRGHRAQGDGTSHCGTPFPGAGSAFRPSNKGCGGANVAAAPMPGNPLCG